MAEGPIAQITFVTGDVWGDPLQIAASEVRMEPYGVVWRPEGEQPPYDRIFPWHRIQEVTVDLPSGEPLVASR
jgi:hypothetical protein